MITPILFLIFNRPETEKRVFEMIRKAKPKVLYVAADGPRKDIKGEKEKCNLARKIVDEGVDWDCKVHKLYRNKNLGCKMAVSGAIDWFFKNVEEGIILEDDCLPDITFFKFCSTLLEKYRDDERIFLISGDNNQKCSFSKNSYYFSKYPHIWGWATWRSSWNKYKVNIYGWRSDYDIVFDNGTKNSEKLFWSNYFDNVADSAIDTWDYQVVYCSFVNKQLNIIPSVNLVENIGVGLMSTHTTKAKYLKPRESIKFPLKYNIELKRNHKADDYTSKIIYKINPFIVYSRWLINLFRHLFVKKYDFRLQK